MLKIDNLTITTLKGRKLLDSFSFVLNDNDKIALIGEEGNGKSTILKIIAGIDVSSYVSYTGNIITDSKIAYLKQSLDEDELDKNVLDYIDEEMDYNHLYSVFTNLNIDESLLYERNMRSLSGGERIKIALLKIVYQDPDILLLDEPTNDLDIKTLIWLENFINNSSLPIIFISHDEILLENCANGILHLEQFKRKTEPMITFSGNGYKQYIQYRNDYIEKNNMIARKEKKEYEKQLEKWRKFYQKLEHAQNTVSRQDPSTGRLLKKKMKNLKSQQRRYENEKDDLRKLYEPEEAIDIFFDKVDINPNKVIVDIDDLQLKVSDRVLCNHIRLKVLGKDKICIIGDNGTGKSTLIKHIAYKLLEKEDMKVAYMPQNYYEVMDYDLTPVEYLSDSSSPNQRAKVQSYLGALRFTSEEMQHSIRELSEGQKCKILIIKMILDKANVLILDEPTRNLSPLSNPIFRKILNDYNGCIISVSHDRKYIDEVIDKVYELNHDGLKAYL